MGFGQVRENNERSNRRQQNHRLKGKQWQEDNRPVEHVGLNRDHDQTEHDGQDNIDAHRRPVATRIRAKDASSATDVDTP